MNISRINTAVKAALFIGLPFMLAACQSPSASTNTPSPPPGAVTATTTQITPAVQSITLSNTTANAASVAIVPPRQSTYFDVYTDQSNTPLWCTGNTCSTPCPSLSFSLSAGQSCKVYIHAAPSTAVGNVQHDQIQVSLNGNTHSYTLTNTGVLYAAGAFTTVDSQAANYLASWNGTSWSPLPGLSSPSYALSIAPNGGLYLGTYASGVKEWTGSQWNTTGNPLASTNGLVAALAFDDQGNLYAGGEFTNIQGVPANKIAEFNGQNWLPVTNPSASIHGVTGVEVTSLLWHDGKLIMAGFFDTIDGNMANNIGVWTNGNWSPLTSKNIAKYPFDSGVYTLAIDQNGRIVAGGDFDNADGQYVGHIAQFMNGNWTAITNTGSHDHGLNVQSFALAFDNQNNLYSGGNFTQADDTPANSIASFNGTNWVAVTSPSASPHGMGGNSEPSVNVLAYDSNSHVMYAGGGFSTVDGLPMLNLAAWNGVDWSPVTNSAAPTHGFDAHVDALAIGNQLSIQESNS